MKLAMLLLVAVAAVCAQDWVMPDEEMVSW